MNLTDETKALIYSSLSERIKDVPRNQYLTSHDVFCKLVLGELPFSRSFPEDCIAYIISEGFDITAPNFPSCEANSVYRELQDKYVETVLDVHPYDFDTLISPERITDIANKIESLFTA